jgi:hypothetical protein
VLIVFPQWPALAQPDSPDTSHWQTYTREDGLLTARIPECWVVEADESGSPGLYIASSSDALMNYFKNQDYLRPGQQAISVLFSPFDASLSEGLPNSAAQLSQSDLTLQLTAYFLDDEVYDLARPIKLQRPEGQCLTILQLKIPEVQQAGFVLAYPFPDGFFMLAFGAAHLDDYTDELQALLLEIIFSVESSGTLVDLLTQYGK